MKLNGLLIPVCVLTLFMLAPLSKVNAQVGAFSAKTRGGSVRMVKDIPIREMPRVFGDGKPTSLYVVQLARFEAMDYIPETFPSGTFLWVSHDHDNEKVLYAGYYASFEEAQKATQLWKQRSMFKSAFPRPTPFLVRYD